jgi:type I restriction enzyme R subunit
MNTFRFFERSEEFAVVEKQLPHWSQTGTLAFITWRTADSLPREVQAELTREREQHLALMGLDPNSDWRAQLSRLPPAERGRVRWDLFQAWDNCLDRAAGAGVLRQPKLSAIVESSLLHFDGKRYFLTDSVVMPNHVHLLVAFPGETQMSDQCESWKRFTAVQINKVLGQLGEFWQVDQFDHLVRNEEQFRHLRQCIAENGRRAGLQPHEFRWFSKDLLQYTL